MDNPSATPCPECGSPHRADAPLGMCAACLWRGLDDLDDVLPPEEKRFDQEKAGLLPVPGHTVLAELARGGMGIVYRARQHAPAREVALKMLLPHQLGSNWPTTSGAGYAVRQFTPSRLPVLPSFGPGPAAIRRSPP